MLDQILADAALTLSTAPFRECAIALAALAARSVLGMAWRGLAYAFTPAEMSEIARSVIASIQGGRLTLGNGYLHGNGLMVYDYGSVAICGNGCDSVFTWHEKRAITKAVKTEIARQKKAAEERDAEAARRLLAEALLDQKAGV